tara:strand:+ start:108 stop:806 length:699 start_codon:yes stop_codon:yes gene_type:complete
MTLGKSFASLGNLISEYQNNGGFARPSRYEIIITPPVGIRSFTLVNLGGLSDTIRQTSLACESISFPGRNIDTSPDTNIYGPVREIATGFSYAEISATFRCSSDMKEKRYFEAWQRLSYDTVTWSMQYYEDYIGAVQIFQLDENDNIMYGVELVEAFPKTIGQMTLDYSSTDQIHKLPVTFSYRWWKNIEDEPKINEPVEEVSTTTPLRRNDEGNRLQTAKVNNRIERGLNP